MNEALDRGYRVTHHYRTLEWKRWTNDLFKLFVQEFAALKTQASGWPRENMTDEEKDSYIFRSSLRAIILDPEKMEYNPGLRYLAKIILNR